MTAHDPRVTLTEVEVERLCDVLEDCDAEYRVEQRVAREVGRIIAARLAPIRAVLDACDETKTATVMISAVRAALDATQADLSASQDHDGTHGPPETNRPSDHQQRLRATFLAAALEDQ